MKFLADGMLGKLTRWLRMLGYDVEYFNDLDDDQLVKKAGGDRRILLTRDMQLYRRASVRGVQAFLVEGQKEAEKLAEMARRFHIRLEIDIDNSRCPKCNSKIGPVSKREVEAKIPESTARFYADFWVCRGCGQIYWQGSHWKKIGKTLNEARLLASSAKGPDLNSSS